MSEHRPFRDMSFEDYAKAEGVSATHLDFISRSPAHLRAHLDGEIEPESDSMKLGTLAHAAIFTPDELTEDKVHILPEFVYMTKERVDKLSSAVPLVKDGKEIVDDQGRLAVVWSGQFAEAKQWLKEHSDGKPVITASEWKKAVRIRDNAHRDSTVRALLSNGCAEQALFVEDEHGTKRKCRYDYISLSGNIVPDLKTARSAYCEDFEKTILNRRYHVRASFYTDNARLAGLGKREYVFIVVENVPPYLVACYQLDPIVAECGRKLMNRDLMVYRHCVEKNDWPGYHKGIQLIALPPWKMKEAEEIATH